MLFRDNVTRNAALLVAALSVLIYSPSLWADYTYDDKVAVMTNPDVQLLSAPTEVFKHDFWGNNIVPDRPGQWTHHSYRPLVVMTFQIDQLLGGGSAAVFHFSNLVLHGAVTVFASSLFFTLWGKNHFILPFVSSLLFALHPVHTEVVANITSRAETVAAVFLVLALAMQARRFVTPANNSLPWLHLRDTVLASTFGVLCKEVSLVFPVVSLWTYAVSHRVASPNKSKNNSFWLLEQARSVNGWFALSMIAFAAILYLIRVQLLSGGYDVDAAPVHNPLQFLHGAAKPMSYAYVQSLAMLMTFFPVYLAHEHNAMLPIESIWDPRNLVTVLFWSAMLSMLFWLHSSTLQEPGLAQSPASLFKHTYSIRARIESEWEAWDQARLRQYCLSSSVRNRCMYGLGVMAVFYGPASHVLVTVAFVLAERTLFLSTVGSVIVLTEFIALLSLWFSCSVFTRATSKDLLETQAEPKEVSNTHISSEIVCLLDEFGAEDEILSMEDFPAIGDCMRRLALALYARVLETQQSADPAKGKEEDEQPSCALIVIPVSDDTADPSSPSAVHEASTGPSSESSGSVRFADAVLKKERKKEQYEQRKAQRGANNLGISGKRGIKRRVLTFKDIAAQQHADHLEPTSHKDSPAHPPFNQRAIADDEQEPPLEEGCSRNFKSFFATLVGIVLLAYTLRLHTRAMEWQDEDVLLESCLRLYPDNNFMTVYGIGTRKLYKGELNEANKLLLQAHEMSPTIAEPLILLSQLHWKHGELIDGSRLAGNKAATEYLLKVEKLNKRSEFLTNLGLLLAEQATSPEELKAAHHASLYAEAAHTLRAGTPMLGPVLHNACCVRLLAPPTTYGDIFMAQELAERAAELQYDENAIGVHNLAVIHAVRGNAVMARYYAHKALAKQYAGLQNMTQRLLTPEAKLLMESFAVQRDVHIPGEVALARLKQLQTACVSSFLWF